ncbi:MAG: hypothetical protein SFU56_18035 [Capsulimonadales bacterium]|nr:hypothetical protein [Capsulimonadales bacterium]
MKIILPIIFLSLFMGLFVKRITIGFWWQLGFGIALIILYNYIKPS